MRRLVAVLLCLFGLVQSTGIAASNDQWLPATTKGYIAVTDMTQMLAAFEHTGLGMIVKDDLMKAYIEDLEKQVNERFGVTGVRIGLSWEDVQAICSKDVCVAFVRPADTVQKHSIATIVNVAGKDAEVKTLLAKVAASMKARKAKARQETWFGVPVSIYTVPTQNRKVASFEVAMVQINDVLIAADHPSVAKDILARIQGTAKTPNLASLAAYQSCMHRCVQDAGGVEPHVRWFFEPLGYAELAQDATGVGRKRRADFLKVLRNQGYDAIQGAGGFVNFNAGDFEILQRSFVYAPAVPGNEPARFKLAARVMEFHRVENLEVPKWVPSSVSSYAAAAWDISESYKYIGTLVDEVAGDEGFWEDLLETIKTDLSGPQIDLNDLMTFFGTRITSITDFQQPITTSSERFLVAIDLKNPEKMQAALDKALTNDPDVHRIDGEGGPVIWEIVDEPTEMDDFEIEADTGSGNDPGADEEGDFDEGRANPFLANAALSVVNGKFIVSSHVDFIKELIANPAPEKCLSSDQDFQDIDKALKEIGAGQDTAKIFSRAGREAHVSYELLREGKMPESKGLIGKVLNEVLGSSDNNIVRQQRIDGKTMPDYEKVERYLGTIGLFLRAEKDGWYIAGITLRNPSLSDNPPQEAVETAASPGGPSDG